MARNKGKGSLQLEPNGIYTLRCTINGKRVSKSTGTGDRKLAERFLEDFMRPYVKDDAQRTYENIQAAVESERQRADRLEDEKEQMKLVDAWDEYVKSPYRRDLAADTIQAKKTNWWVFVKWIIGDGKTKGVFPEITEVRQVRPDIAEAYLDMMRIEHAASTYNNRLCVLREIFRVLSKKARCKINPFDGIPLRADDSHSRRELTIEELERLVTCATRAGDSWKTLFAIGMYTGLRLGDCCTLRWSEVDIPRCIIQREPHKTKRYSKGKPVTIPIHPVLSDVLCQTLKSERLGYVLPTLAKMYLSKGGRPEVSRQIKKIFTAAGIVTSVAVEGRKWKAPEATFHSLRHTFVSLSANAGVPLHIVQSIVGHESTAMTRHYYHENIEALTRAVAAIPVIGETAKPLSSSRRVGVDVPPENGIEYFPAEMEPEVPGDIIDVEPARPIQRPQESAVRIPQPQLNAEPQESAVRIPQPQLNVEPQLDAQHQVNAERKPEPVEEEKKPVVIPHGAKVEIREFGRVYVDGVPTGGRIGGAQARPRPPKQAWFGDVIRVWSKRRHTGILEGSLELVSNGGHKFLQQLYERNTIHDPTEACDVCEAYLKGRGILF